MQSLASLSFDVDLKPLNDAEKKLDDVGKASGKADKPNRKFNTGLNDMQKKALAASAALAAISFKKFIDFADEYRSINQSIKSVISDTENFAEVQQDIINVANGSSTALADVADTFRSVHSAVEGMGGSTKDAIRLTDLITKAMKTGGGTAEGHANALRQVNQGLVSGVLRGEEFNSMMEQAPGLANAIAEGLGVLVGDLRGMAENGELTAERLNTALNNASGSIEKNFENLPLTSGRAWTLVQNSAVVALGKVDEVLGGVSTKWAEGIAGVATKITELTESFTSLFKDPAIVDGVSTMSEKQEAMLLILQKIKPIIDGVKEGFDLFVSSAQLAWEGIKNIFDSVDVEKGSFLGDMFRSIGGFIVDNLPLITAFALGVVSIGAAIGIVSGAFAILTGILAVNPIVLIITAIAAGALALYKNWDGIAGFFSGIWNGIATSVSNAWTGIKSVLDAFVPQVIKDAWSGTKEFFGGVWDGTKSAFSTGIDAAKAVLSTLTWENIKTVWNGLTQWWGTLFTEFKKSPSDAIDFVVETIKKFTPQHIQDAWNGLTQWWTDLFAKFGTTPGEVFEKIKNAILKYTPHGLIYTHWDGITDYWNRLWSDFPKTISETWDAIKTTLSNAIANIIKTIVGFGTDAGAAAKEAGGKIVDNVVEGVKGLPGKMVDKAADTVQGLKNGLFGGVTDLFNAGKDLAKSTIGGYTDEMDIRSPSKAMEQQGTFTWLGLAKGVLAGDVEVAKAGGELAVAVINPIKEIIPEAEDVGEEVVKNLETGIKTGEAGAVKVAEKISTEVSEAFDNITESQKIRRLELEKGPAALEAYELAQEGLTDDMITAIQVEEAAIIALEDKAEAAEEAAEALKGAKDAIADAEVEQAALNATLLDGEDAGKKIKLMAEGYTSELADQQIEIDKTNEKLKDQIKVAEDLKKTFDGFADSFVDGLIDGDGLKDTLKSVGDDMLDWLKDLGKQFLSNKLKVAIDGGEGTGGILNGISNLIGGLFSSGSATGGTPAPVNGLQTSVPSADSLKPALNAGVQAAGAVPIPQIQAAVAAIQAAQAISGAVRGSTTADSGDLDRGRIIGGLVGEAFVAEFKSKFKTVEEGIAISIKDGEAQIRAYEEQEKKRLIRSDKTRTVYSEADAEVVEFVRGITNNMTDTIREQFLMLGQSTEGVVKESIGAMNGQITEFFDGFDVPEFEVPDGEDFEEAFAEWQADTLTGAYQHAIEQASPRIRELVGLQVNDYAEASGETLAEALAVATTATNIVGPAFANIGVDMGNMVAPSAAVSGAFAHLANDGMGNLVLGLSEFDEASVKLVEELGGAEAAIEKMNNILSLAPESVQLQSALDSNIASLATFDQAVIANGGSVIRTTDDLYAYIQAQDATTEAGRQNIAMAEQQIEAITNVNSIMDAQQGQIELVSGAFEALGANLVMSDGSALGFSDRIIELSGGLEGFGQNASNAMNLMFTAEEQTRMQLVDNISAVQAWNDELGLSGDAMIDTKEEYKDLFKQQEETLQNAILAGDTIAIHEAEAAIARTLAMAEGVGAVIDGEIQMADVRSQLTEQELLKFDAVTTAAQTAHDTSIQSALTIAETAEADLVQKQAAYDAAVATGHGLAIFQAQVALDEATAAAEHAREMVQITADQNAEIVETTNSQILALEAVGGQAAIANDAMVAAAQTQVDAAIAHRDQQKKDYDLAVTQGIALLAEFEKNELEKAQKALDSANAILDTETNLATDRLVLAGDEIRNQNDIQAAAEAANEKTLESLQNNAELADAELERQENILEGIKDGGDKHLIELAEQLVEEAKLTSDHADSELAKFQLNNDEKLRIIDTEVEKLGEYADAANDANIATGELADVISDDSSSVNAIDSMGQLGDSIDTLSDGPIMSMNKSIVDLNTEIDIATIAINNMSQEMNVSFEATVNSGKATAESISTSINNMSQEMNVLFDATANSGKTSASSISTAFSNLNSNATNIANNIGRLLADAQRDAQSANAASTAANDAKNSALSARDESTSTLRSIQDELQRSRDNADATVRAQEETNKLLNDIRNTNAQTSNNTNQTNVELDRNRRAGT